MQDSENFSPSELTIGHQSAKVTSMTDATALRNQEDYDDWEYGTEPIPGDTNWVTHTND